MSATKSPKKTTKKPTKRPVKKTTKKKPVKQTKLPVVKYQPDRPSKRRSHRKSIILLGILIMLGAVAYGVGRYETRSQPVAVVTPTPMPSPSATPPSVGGQLLNAGTPQVLTTAQITSAVKWRYGSQTPTAKYPVTVQTIEYTSADIDGTQLTEYARVYIPQGMVTTPGVISFGAGTTGLGASCAISTEQSTIHNLGDYNAHFLAYASQGNVVVATDYPGMLISGQLEAYMVGELEGRALLDSVRAARQLSGTSSWSAQPVFLLGYSQGGQADFWADQIDKSYAPDVKLAGLVAFAPVSNVLQTWQGILHGSTIDWFGPYVLASYTNYYQQPLGINQILLPKWVTNLQTDVTNHCIDSVTTYYGTNPSLIYTPQFLAALSSGDLPSYGFTTLASELDQQNITEGTTTPKLLLQGLADTTILPAQTSAMNTLLCQLKSGRVSEQTFAKSSHYSIIPDSFTQSLAWINAVRSGQTAATNCPPST